MRARDIQPGHDYWLRVRVTPVRPVTGVRHGGRGFPGWTVRQRATVVDIAPQAGRPAVVTVEATRWRCVNAHWFTNDLARAMVDGKLRYRPQPQRCTVPVRHVLAPAPAASDEDAKHGQARQQGRAS